MRGTQPIITFLLCILVIVLLFSCQQNQQGSKENDTFPVSVVAGHVERIENMESKYVGARHIDVYLPQGYHSRDRYAVVYMHDGQMLFDNTHTWNKQEWGVDETIMKLINNQTIDPVIVVGIWHTEDRHSDYFPQKPIASLTKTIQDSILSLQRNKNQPLFTQNVQSDKYLQFIVEELKPFIDKQYMTNPSREHTFIAGSSMGGLISMYAMCEYPEIFSGAACLSTHWPGIFPEENNPIPQVFYDYLETHIPNPKHHTFYFDYGTETLDKTYEQHQVIVDSIFRAKGYNNDNYLTIKIDGADHSETSWNNRLSIPFTFLLSNQ